MAVSGYLVSRGEEVRHDTTESRRALDTGWRPSGTAEVGRELAGDAADRNGDEMQYAWDANGDLTGVTYPDGNTATYAYNQFGEMTSMKDWLSHTTSFTYDLAGNLSTITYPNSTVATYGYDPSEQMDKIAVTKSGTAQFSFDASGTNGLDASGNIQKMTNYPTGQL